MGIMSRRVLPVCGSMCVCCPALRARSRQPVKRYNMLLADIFPKTQDEVPNDRKIGKLVEYASKNPMRIPKIANGLEQRGYKELRSEHYGSVRAVMRAYSKLFISCRDEMSLFAISALNMIRALLDQPRQDDMRKLGCQSLVDFIRIQTDATYMRNLDAFLPGLCALAREHGEDKRRMPIRAAALRALSAMVGFMGLHSHISADFDEIVTVTLDNFELPTVEDEALEIEKGEAQHRWVKEVMRSEGRAHAVQVLREAMAKMQRHKSEAHIKDPATLTREEMEMPSVWSQICVQNMATLAKEATTVRRVLEPMLRYFDVGKQWSLDRGLSLVVLQDMQFLMEKTGNDQLLLAALVRHLDHKNVEGDLLMKTNIVALTAVLARHSKAKATVAEVGAMSDLSKHLRRSLQSSMEISSAGNPKVPDHNIALQTAIEECLMEFGRRVGDAGPLLDMMAATLEKLSAITVVARSTVQAVSVLALAVAYLPDHLYAHEEFPDSLFNELLQAMLYHDVETRIGAHRILVLLLVPASASHSSRFEQQFLPQSDIPSAPSPSRNKRRVSAFASAAVLFERLRKERSMGSYLDSDDEGFEKEGQLKGRTESMGRVVGKTDSMGKGEWGRMDSMGRDEVRSGREDTISGASPSRLQAFRLSLGRSMAHLRRPSAGAKETEMTTARVSGQQAELLLSTLWLQANMADNWPSSYEAMAHTYSLALLFSRPRSFSHSTQVRAVQLALSLRSLALDANAAQVSPARRRSLFTLSTAMLVFAAKTYSYPQIIAPAKVPLTPIVKDPFLELSEESTLTAVSSAVYALEYGTFSDDNAALSSLTRISLTGDLSNEGLVARIVEASPSLIELEGEGVRERLTQPFTPEDNDLIGSRRYSDTLYARSAHASQESISFDESQLLPALSEEDGISDTSPELPRLLRDNVVPASNAQAPGVSQLLESALETAGQVGSVHPPSGPLSYSATASQCEAAGAGTHKKMSAVLKLDSKGGPLMITLPNKEDPHSNSNGHDSSEARKLNSNPELEGARTAPATRTRSQSPTLRPSWLLSPTVGESHPLKLPPSSPYDNFLKAAGC